jgi:hypothetical protein
MPDERAQISSVQKYWGLPAGDPRPHPVAHRVNDLHCRLKTLRRPLLMLETLLRSERLDAGLLADIEKPGEFGIASHPCDATLSQPVDALRERTLTPRGERYTDNARARVQLRDATER